MSTSETAPEPQDNPQISRNFHTHMTLFGSVGEMDEHQKHVEELGALADIEVSVEKGHVKDGQVMARFQAHFHAEKAMDAVFMAHGLFGSDLENTSIEIVEVVASR